MNFRTYAFSVGEEDVSLVLLQRSRESRKQNTLFINLIMAKICSPWK